MRSPSSGDDRGKWRVVKVERLVPAESRIWLEVGLLMLTLSAGAALVALTLSEGVQISAVVLWTITAACVAQAVTCFVAHWSTNRGRKERRSEVIEEKWEDLGPDL